MVRSAAKRHRLLFSTPITREIYALNFGPWTALAIVRLLGTTPIIVSRLVWLNGYCHIAKPFAGAICDFDQSGLCDLADIDAMHEIGPISDGIPVDSATESFDLNGDGQINLEDRDIWLLEAATANGLESEYILGDANLDGVVDVSDFNQWNANRFASSLLWSDGNFNGDSRIDVTDFNIWNSNKFRSSNPMVVPEPHSLVMIALGLFFGTFFRKQHHNV